MTTKPTNSTPPATQAAKPRVPSDKFAQAGRVARRLSALDAEETQALAEAPADIRKRYAAKREAALSATTQEVRELVQKMRAE